MINFESILSSFNCHGTLLKWLKTIEKALKESVLKRVDVIDVTETEKQLKFVFADETSITTPVFTLATTDDIEQLESEIEALQTNKQNKIVDSDEIIIDNETNELMLNNTISNKIAKSLITPTTAPTSTELVGIDTSNAQTRIKIGDGLSVENDTLKATNGGASGGVKFYKHELNFGGHYLYFISTSNVPVRFVGGEDIPNIIEWTGGYEGLIPLQITGNSDLIRGITTGDTAVYYINYAGETQFYSASSLISDTVTEL